MRRFFALVMLALAAATPARAGSFDPAFLQSLGNTTHHEIHAERLGRDFHVYVRVPAGQNADNRSYPTVYVLDGGELFPLIASYHDYLQFGEGLPEAIIVGISYGSDNSATGNRRSTDYTAPSDERDYWGGAGAFQRFLEEELIPFVEARYPARADRRIIFGQSIGGQFVLYTAQTHPSLFWGHIASNPALHRNLDFFLETRPESISDSRLFVASATGDDPEFRAPALAWIEHWSATPKKPWTLQVKHLDGHSHMSAPPASYRHGMRWLFGDD